LLLLKLFFMKLLNLLQDRLVVLLVQNLDLRADNVLHHRNVCRRHRLYFAHHSLKQKLFLGGSLGLNWSLLITDGFVWVIIFLDRAMVEIEVKVLGESLVSLHLFLLGDFFLSGFHLTHPFVHPQQSCLVYIFYLLIDHVWLEIFTEGERKDSFLLFIIELEQEEKTPSEFIQVWLSQVLFIDISLNLRDLFILKIQNLSIIRGPQYMLQGFCYLKMSHHGHTPF